jgi:hypothetical protein
LWLGEKGKKLLNYNTKLHVFHKRKFLKLRPGTQVSFLNEAPEALKLTKYTEINLKYKQKTMNQAL